jgi:hypothetical protein
MFGFNAAEFWYVYKLTNESIPNAIPIRRNDKERTE